MKKKIIYFTIVGSALLLGSCSGGPEKGNNQNIEKREVSDYDPERGEGKFDENNVVVGALDGAMAKKGQAISETKCMSCHKLSDEKLVGPGWKGVTDRRTPHWIMNFITNPDAMIDKDPEVQAQLELCLVRMPNQNLADEEARSILEYMRENDGVK
ncbi:MAG: cytochrome c [Crocinitomicaceae bacterium]|nr:cytochrome c [Crocinitomicaceae bacterium]